MANLSKRQKDIKSQVEAGKPYPVLDAFSLIKDTSKVKFVESVDASVNLGVDPRKSDQVVRGSTVLPNGTGKDVKVAVFAQGENAEKAKAAGAEEVGYEDLAAKFKAGDFMGIDVIIATPDSMRVVGQLGQILGPKGLMPNPKVGTVTPDVATAVKNAKSGQVRYRTDKTGIIHCSIGKVDFSAEQLKQNLEALVVALKKGKPAAAKGVYFKKITVSSTMGPGLTVDQGTMDI